MKIKLIFLSTLIMSSFLTAKAQNIHVISLTAEKIYLLKGGFSIDSIVDDRVSIDDIGFVQKGFFNKVARARLSGGLLFTLEQYFNYSLPKSTDKTPLLLKVSKFEISEKTEFSAEYAEAELIFNYYFGDKLLYTSKVRASTRGLDVTKLHEANINDILTKSLRHFDRTNWEDKLMVDEEELDTLQSLEVMPADHSDPPIVSIYRYSSLDEIIKETKESKNRNVFTIGYQIGGYTLVGIDYEVRVSDYFGVHFGGGFAGYTAGLKIHTDDTKNSPFFNINVKDGGFGLIRTGGVDFGGRIPFSRKNDFGLHLQGGFGKILSVDQVIVEKLFNSTVPPEYMLTVGVGFGW
jgi:hypothetical protein